MSENKIKAGGTEEEEEGLKSLTGDGDKAKWAQQWLAIDCLPNLYSLNKPPPLSLPPVLVCLKNALPT